METHLLNDKQSSQVSPPLVVTPLNKGLGFLDRALDPKDIAKLGWNLLHEDLSLPAAILYEDRLHHNLNWMQKFITAYGVKLAPHGKTTMAPALFSLQLQGGAWGITLATAHQTLVAYAHGVRRILMANQLIGKENMAIIERLLQDPSLEYYCLVDSVEQVVQLGRFYSKSGLRLRVLLELGVDGVLDDEAPIRAFLQHAVAVTRKLAAENRFQRAPILLSGAGSAWYDIVAEIFSAAGFGDTVDIVLRPGCYLTHDIGAYRMAQTKILERNPIARQMHSGLLPALQVWAYVQSIPEPEKAIIGLGKRDAAFDSGFPIPALHFRPGNASPDAVPANWAITKMMDQHAYLAVAAQDDIRVGDMIGFDISHPCLTFDKWRTLSVVDSKYQIIDIIQTFF
jgi:D-serine dehydratase